MEILQSFAIDDGREGIRDGLQRFREWLDGLDDPLADEDEPATFLSKLKLFHKKHQSARTRWIAPADFPSPAIIDGYMKPAVDSSAASFTWGKPDIDGLRLYCANSIGWDDEETDRIVQPVLKIIESGSKQTRIESYFMKYDDNIKFAEVRSKRLKAVLDDIQTKGYIKTSKKRRRIS
jgi:DNA excision repair protein ERCC-5